MSNTTSTKRKTAAGSGTISTAAWEIISKGAEDNPDRENTVAMAESDGKTTVYRIFRQRHLNRDPLEAADHWIRTVKAHCTGTHGELEVVAVHTETDGSSVLVGITGLGTSAKEETLLVDSSLTELG